MSNKMLGSVRFTPAHVAKLPDPAAEVVRTNTDQRIKELQSLPAAGMQVIKGVTLVNGVETHVPHGLGREPIAVIVSPPYGDGNLAVLAGLIIERRGFDSNNHPIDRRRVVCLFAGSFGPPINVDVVVM